MEKPTITTVIPAFNEQRFIGETLECLARQTRRPDRVVVVDDGSSDRTEEIVRNFQGLQCEWAPNERNLGLFPNHNGALRFAAETKFLHILHANDLVSPTFFEKLAPLIENAPKFALAFSGHVFIREDCSETAQRYSIGGAIAHQLSLKEFLESQTELKAIQLHSALMRTDYQNLPVEFRLDFPQTADVVFHSQFATHCSQIWGHPDVLAQVRIHQNAVTNRNMKNINAWVRDEWRTMQLVYEIMKSQGMGSWTRGQKLKLLFAARSHVKIKMVRSIDESFARRIREEAQPHTGLCKWMAGGMIVALRDRFFPKKDAAAERLEGVKA